MMNVTVIHSPIGVAEVEIDLGQGHTLFIRAAHDTDRYRKIVAQWVVPAHVTGPAEQVRDRHKRILVRERLDLRTGQPAEEVTA